MDQGTENESFDQSVNKWSLRFHNAVEEQLYQQDIIVHPPNPYMMKVVAFIVINLTILYRFYMLSAAALGLPTKTAGFTFELIFALAVVAATLIEFVLYMISWFKPMQGVLLYITLSCLLIAAAFYTMKGPYIGIMYCPV